MQPPPHWITPTYTAVDLMNCPRSRFFLPADLSRRSGAGLTSAFTTGSRFDSHTSPCRNSRRCGSLNATHDCGQLRFLTNNRLRILNRKSLTPLIEKFLMESGSFGNESAKGQTRFVIELKRDAPASVVLNNLYKHTPLQTSFAANM